MPDPNVDEDLQINPIADLEQKLGVHILMPPWVSACIKSLVHIAYHITSYTSATRLRTRALKYC